MSDKGELISAAMYRDFTKLHKECRELIIRHAKNRSMERFLKEYDLDSELQELSLDNLLALIGDLEKAHHDTTAEEILLRDRT